MIFNISGRSDIVAFYSDWFFHRLKEEYVYVRNPYYPTQITKYLINEDVVDCFVFCTKNPHPILSRLDELKPYPSFFYVTITPYGKQIEPYVPHYQDVISDIQKLSLQLGPQSVGIRYDPIFINQEYTFEKHLFYFEDILSKLQGYTHLCVISFIDLYQKTKRNFPGIQEVSYLKQQALVEAFVKIARKYQFQIQMCAEPYDFSYLGVSSQSCLNEAMLKNITGYDFISVSSQPLRQHCHCYPSRDIGEYHTCPNGCLYCYANENKQKVIENYKRHDPRSPLLIGHVHKDDIIKQAKQKSYKQRQLSLDL